MKIFYSNMSDTVANTFHKKFCDMEDRTTDIEDADLVIMYQMETEVPPALHDKEYTLGGVNYRSAMNEIRCINNARFCGKKILALGKSALFLNVMSGGDLLQINQTTPVEYAVEMEKDTFGKDKVYFRSPSVQTLRPHVIPSDDYIVLAHKECNNTKYLFDGDLGKKPTVITFRNYLQPETVYYKKYKSIAVNSDVPSNNHLFKLYIIHLIYKLTHNFNLIK